MSSSSARVIRLQREPIDVASIRAALASPEDGAVLLFEGIVRNNSKGRATRQLDYEAYEPMALQVMTSLAKDIAGRHQVSSVAIVHRLGRMFVGETSVVIGAASPHRGAAFAAVREGIDRLKRTVPIWKKEYFVDGEIWVEGEWDASLPR